MILKINHEIHKKELGDIIVYYKQVGDFKFNIGFKYKFVFDFKSMNNNGFDIKIPISMISNDEEISFNAIIINNKILTFHDIVKIKDDKIYKVITSDEDMKKFYDKFNQNNPFQIDLLS